MMSGQCEEGDGVHSSVETLSRLASNVDKDDLATLAKMHKLCEVLLETCGANGSAPASSIVERVTALAPELEAMILDEAEDADAALDSIRELARGLADIEASLPFDDQAKTDLGELSDDQVAAKLDRVFGDDEPGAQSADGSALVSPLESAAADSEGPTSSESEQADEGSPAPASPGDGKAESAEPGYEQTPLVIDQREIEFVETFVEEAREHIEAIEAAVLEVERTPDDTAKIDDLFRPFHTIKGAAGFLNLRDVNCLTHEVETLLDQARKGNRVITPGLIDLVFDAVDILKVQFSAIGAYLADPNGDSVPQPSIAGMIAHLRSVVAGHIDPAGRQVEKGSASQKIGENLVEQGAVPQEAVDFAVDLQKAGRSDKKTGEILLESQAVTPKQVSQAIRPQTRSGAGVTGGPASSAGGQPAELTVRIETAKLDALVDMVGELVIAQTQVGANATVATDPRLTKSVNEVTKIVRDVQEVAMAMRMVPIGPTFQKMARLVRDVARKADKRVDLIISGEDTELDKNVIQQIGDPLVHMIRNAVDHGIELPDARRKVGKNEVGSIHLSASHQGGNIVIEITDDGKGLDAQALIAKGIEKGLVQPGEELSDAQAFALIFAPGFSMAKQVTDISGRGVGMDVVKRNIEQLRGKVDISSVKGEGSTFSIRLPLTLAIIDGMIVRVGSERIIIPTIAIKQSLRPLQKQITTVQGRGEVLNVRGRLVPLVQLGVLFGLSERIDPCETMVVVAQCDEKQIGIVVEELLDQQQVVIKSLGERFRDLQGISGAAILGDGRVGLILDIYGVATAHARWQGRERASSPKAGLSAKEDRRQNAEDLAASATGDEPCETAVRSPGEQQLLRV